jgi:hypothetical protein
MAARLARGAFLIALVALVAASGACTRAQAPPGESTVDPVAVAGSLTVAIFRTLNDATAENYVLQTLIDADAAVGDSQACMNPDNRISQRPSALANPPYSEASIEQRDRLLRALGAYEVAVASIYRAAPAAETGVALANVQRTVLALGAVANMHTQGDLFIDQGAAEFLALAARLRNARNAAEQESIAKRARPLGAKLVSILRVDVSERRLEALAATRREAGLWLAYGALTSSSAARKQHRPALPRCSSPIVPAPVASAGVTTGPAPSGSIPAVSAGFEEARDCSAALESVSLDAFFGALLDLDKSAPRLQGGTDSTLQRLRATMPASQQYIRLLSAST